MQTSSDKKLFELRTTINLEEMSDSLQADFNELLKTTVYEASANYPTVKAFFVRYIPEQSEVIVGLRIEKSSDDGIENISDALIRDSLENAIEQVGNQNRAVIEESELTLT